MARRFLWLIPGVVGLFVVGFVLSLVIRPEESFMVNSYQHSFRNESCDAIAYIRQLRARLPWQEDESLQIRWAPDAHVFSMTVFRGGLFAKFEENGTLIRCAEVVPQSGALRVPVPAPVERPRSAPYTASEVRDLIRTAKLRTQEGAARGEVALPANWEAAQ